MKLYDDFSAGALANAEPSYERQDLQRRDIVNHAIEVLESSNTMSAVEYLKSHNIHPDLIARVLLEPAKRRAPSHH